MKNIKYSEKEMYFIAFFMMWYGILNIDKKLDFGRIKNKKMLKYIAYVIDGKRKNIIRWNHKYINQSSKTYLRRTALHELGHLVKKPDRTKKWKENWEYEAELFALTKIKEYYPKYLKQSVTDVKNIIKDNEKYRKYFNHVRAFKRVLKEVETWKNT